MKSFAQIVKESDEREEYALFKKEWEDNHSISPPPSFKSWKEKYNGISLKKGTDQLTGIINTKRILD